MRSIFWIAILLYIASSCKTLLRTSSEDTIIVDWNNVLLDVDTVYLITLAGDTLLGLNSEIAIPTYRWIPDTITIAAVGDIMTGTNFPDEAYLPRDTGRYLWSEVQPILRAADITFGNLEGTILNKGGEQKTCSNPDLCYLFRSPEFLAANFQESGFDLMSVANNHANDFGKTGRLNTQKVLDSLGITHAGSIDQPYVVKKIGHLKVGFCAFSPNKGTVSIHEYDEIRKIVQDLDSLSDLVIASFHAGAEGPKHQNVTRKREYYYGEDRGNVYELAHLLIDQGADVVLGHGPHVVRALEVYNNRIIAYSLGNFLTYGRFNLLGLAGEAPILEIKTDAEGKFLTGKLYAFRQDYDLGPRNDLHLSSIKTIQRLSLNDFPENPIRIDNKGKISYIPDPKP
ncbi:MAG: CapA family protein [Bacteroidota bacterium]